MMTIMPVTLIMVLTISTFPMNMNKSLTKVQKLLTRPPLTFTKIKKLGKRKRKTNGKKAKKEKDPAIAKPSQQINRFFNNASAKPKPKPAPVNNNRIL